VALDGNVIVGYMTVAPAEINIEDLPQRAKRRLPRYPLPVLRLARLAVDERARGRGVERALLRATLRFATRMQVELGCVAVVVDAKPDAVNLYERLGFERFEPVEGALQSRPAPVSLVLPVSAIRFPPGNG